MIKFTIPGDPVAQGRPRASIKKGKIHMHDPEKSRNYKEYVKLVCRKLVLPDLIDEPISLELEFHREIPGSWNKKKKQQAIAGDVLPAVKSDIDNYAKSVMDGMTGIIYKDDKLVCELKLSKRYSEDPRTEVKIKRCHFKTPLDGA
ncbi:RusA family crossover junction endodeoxyribonuclease [Bacillus sp. V3B]|uniref:RusA family crossover junction endodeoxyribonuclease n=1 Tax=Bacillus sp. V3B TaxID=2804915 RepID=UPI00210D3592|nr:RusA family crossover junction endodeoxyribonuclease [Bacillus sp. V3B]MCQ6275774.1 RusA family crossover junction endodeoxyribonuclease [Bacillus sp. V3B]